MFKSLGLALPLVGLHRIEDLRRKGPIDDAAHLLKRRSFAGCQDLYADVPECGGLGGPSQHSFPRRIRGGMVEQPIVRAATDHANLIGALSASLLQAAHNQPILPRQTSEDASHSSAWTCRRGLT